MTSFRQIEANRVRTQEQRSEKKLANDDRGQMQFGTEDRRKRRYRVGDTSETPQAFEDDYLQTTLELP